MKPINNALPVVFIISVCGLLLLGAKKPKLFEYEAFNSVVSGLTTSAIALSTVKNE
jgi:hypothetical protein